MCCILTCWITAALGVFIFSSSCASVHLQNNSFCMRGARTHFLTSLVKLTASQFWLHFKSGTVEIQDWLVCSHSSYGKHSNAMTWSSLQWLQVGGLHWVAWQGAECSGRLNQRLPERIQGVMFGSNKMPPCWLKASVPSSFNRGGTKFLWIQAWQYEKKKLHLVSQGSDQPVSQ